MEFTRETAGKDSVRRAGHPPGMAAVGRRWLGVLLLVAMSTASASDPVTWTPATAEAGGSPVETSPRESFLVRHWTTQHGLPQNTVTCLEQGHDGYLWLGTRYGLVRYDGVQFTVYLAELKDVATEAVDCRQLVADEAGTLWVLTRSGLFSQRAGRFRVESPAVPGGATPRIDAMAASRAGGLWLGGPAGVARLREGQWERISPEVLEAPDESVAEILEDRLGRLWVQCVHGEHRPWRRIDPRTGEIRTLAEVVGQGWPAALRRPAFAWESVFEDRAGRLWVGSPEELACVDGGQVIRHSADGFWKGHSVRAMREDGDGNLWIVTEGSAALHRFDGHRVVSMSRIGTQTFEPDIRSMLSDREGNLWIGSGSAGVYRIQQRQLLSQLRSSDSSRDEVFSIHAAADGGAWLGTPRGVLRVGPGGTRLFQEPEEAGGPRSKPVFADRAGRVWVGVLGAGLSRLEGEVVVRTGIRSSGGSLGWNVRALFEDRAGEVWAGSSAGLLHLGVSETNWVVLPDGLEGMTILGIQQTPDGALWIGTDGAGVGILEGERWRRLRKADGLLHDRVWPLAVEVDGAIWLGSPLGLNRVRGREIRAVTAREGLHDNLAYSLLDDGRGWYWSHCNRGIWRMRKDELNAVADGRAAHVFCISYDETDGMESTEGNGDEQPSAARLKGGELWFPTTRGVVIVDPARLRDNAVPPLPAIVAVVADGREVFGPSHPGGPPANERGREPSVRIGPGQGKVLELHYTAPSFLDAERLRFRYRLAGHDEAWHEAGGRRVAYYTALAPGQYRFEVSAGNHHGYWSDAPAALDFEIAPRFRQTWTFRGLCVGVVLSGLGVLHLRRVRYLRQIESLRRRQSVEAERGRIARDLHDDLGAGLAGIALQVDLARSMARGGQAVDLLLDRVTHSARGLVDQLREVVWALNPACDSLEDFVTFVSGFTEDLLGPAQVRCRLEFPPVLPRLFLPAEARYGLVLAVKEALANSVSHGHPTQVRLAIAFEGRELILRIEDDGVGFDPATVEARPLAAGGARGGSGLPNLRRRLAAVGGEFQVVSAPGAGTTVILRLPLETLPP